LVTADDEVDLAVGPFGRWWWSLFLLIIVLAIVVVQAMSVVAWIISSVVASVVMAIITTITPVVIVPVIAAIIAAIITSIPIIIARIGPAITTISSIRSTVTVVEALATVPIVVVVAPGPLGGRRDSQGALQLLALPHGVFSDTVKLALVVHDHVEVTFEEGGRT
jgi:hypothetical protein